MRSCASGRSRTPSGSRGASRVLCDAELRARSTALALDQQRALLERNLGERSYTGFLETAADGLADVAYLELARPRSSCPPTCPSSRSRGACRRRPTLPRRPCPTRRSRSSRTPRRSPALCERLAPAGALAVDIETDCGPLGAPADWSPADGAVRLLQVAARSRRRDRVRRRRLLRGRAAAAAAPARRRPRDHRPQRPLRAGLAELALRPAGLGCTSSTRAARSASSSATGRSRIPPTSAATRRSPPSRGACSARRRATYGPDWWGAEPLPAAAARLRRLRRGRADRAARPGAGALADAFGCTDQVLAASRTACREAARRLPGLAPGRLARGLSS